MLTLFVLSFDISLPNLTNLHVLPTLPVLRPTKLPTRRRQTLRYKRSRCGKYWHIISSLSLGSIKTKFPVRVLPLSLHPLRISTHSSSSPPAMRCPNSSLSSNRNSLAVSFDRMESLRDPYRGDDPDEHTVKAPTSYNFLEFIVIICLLLAHGGVTRISVAHDFLIFL